MRPPEVAKVTIDTTALVITVVPVTLKTENTTRQTMVTPLG